jgi:hypothetical protein
MHIPRPKHWSIAADKAWIEHILKPAFLKALREIEDVSPCHGMDIEQYE